MDQVQASLIWGSSGGVLVKLLGLIPCHTATISEIAVKDEASNSQAYQ